MEFSVSVVLRILFLCGWSFSVSKAFDACRFNQFRCADGSGCLSTEKLCNEIHDCRNGEDEKRGVWCGQTFLSSECKANEFRCRFGGCIPESKKCDSIFDCEGGTDEATDFCTGKSKPPQKAPSDTKLPWSTSARPLTLNVDTTTFKYYPSPLSHIPSTSLPSSSTPFPSSSSGTHNCPPIENRPGELVVCKQSRHGLTNCLEKESPSGTIAEISCAQFYYSTTGRQKTSKVCEKGTWEGGHRRFRCQLDCGKGGYKPVGLVAGGTTSVKGKWPWHVGLYEIDVGTRKFRNICGATLISERAIVTAAHCVTYAKTNRVKDLRRLKLFLGKFHRDVDKNDDDVQTMKIVKIIVHEKYSHQYLESDIAMLFTDKTTEITPIVHPICLPDDLDYEVPVGMDGTLVGWGSIGNRVYPDLLQEASLPVINHQKCRANHPALSNLVRATTFCAGYANGTSACDGDSGSGLVFPHSKIKNKWSILGIVSGGVPLEGGASGCDPNHYVAFTNVAKYRDWIDKCLEQTPYLN